ncbi:MAG TPA: hypothetical protein VGO62_05780 [Myxococcota bacterium]
MPTLEHAPLPTTFVPAMRMGLLAGMVIAIGGVVLCKAPSRPLPPAPAPVAIVVGEHSPLLHGPAVINVWLEGCRDCMPAFEEWSRLVENGVTRDMHVENIAYGGASPAWAARYHVDERLSTDPDGTRVVHPLNIGTFTTFVVDKKGEVILRGRPAPGFASQLRDAWALATR